MKKIFKRLILSKKYHKFIINLIFLIIKLNFFIYCLIYFLKNFLFNKLLILKFIGLIFIIILIFSYIMWFWCWIIISFKDPGLIETDLKKRGLYEQIKSGIIPHYLSSLPLCQICHLPMPLGSVHCDICGKCHLRSHHHCNFFGFCIAHLNIKAFSLCLIYSFIFGISLFILSTSHLYFILNFDKNSFNYSILGFSICLLSLLIWISFNSRVIFSIQETSNNYYNNNIHLIFKIEEDEEISKLKKLLLYIENFLPLIDNDENLSGLIFFCP